MKVKLLKFCTFLKEAENEYDYDTIQHIVNGFTDFTEIERKDFIKLKEFVVKYNAKPVVDGEYLMVVEYEEPKNIKLLLDEFLAKEKAALKAKEVKEAADKIERERRMKETAAQRKIKQKARLEKKLLKLKEELQLVVQKV